MTTRHLVPFVLAALASAVAAPAQEEYDTSPAKELARLKPLIGNWQGSGKMFEPTGQETPWTAKGTYRWALNGHFVQEDFVIKMEGIPVPMVFRTTSAGTASTAATSPRCSTTKGSRASTRRSSSRTARC